MLVLCSSIFIYLFLLYTHILYICTYWSCWECFLGSFGQCSIISPLWNAQWISWATFVGTAVQETNVDPVQYAQRCGRLKRAGICILKYPQIHVLVHPIRIFSFRLTSVPITIRLPHITFQWMRLAMQGMTRYLATANTVARNTVAHGDCVVKSVNYSACKNSRARLLWRC